MTEMLIDEDPAPDWTPHEQRWRRCDGHMEREEGRLQLRVALCGREGVCSVLFEEDDESITVLILVCGEGEPNGDWCDCPVHIYLERPLGDRVVRDVVQGRRQVPYRNVYDEMKREGLFDDWPSRSWSGCCRPISVPDPAGAAGARQKPPLGRD